MFTTKVYHASVVTSTNTNLHTNRHELMKKAEDIFNLLDPELEGTLSLESTLIALGRMGFQKTTRKAVEFHFVYHFKCKELTLEQFKELVLMPERSYAVLVTERNLGIAYNEVKKQANFAHLSIQRQGQSVKKGLFKWSLQYRPEVKMEYSATLIQSLVRGVRARTLAAEKEKWAVRKRALELAASMLQTAFRRRNGPKSLYA